MRHLTVACFTYANQHNGQFPGELADLVTAGIITDEVLKKVRAALDDPDGPAVIQYRQPNTDAEDRSAEVMLYEAYDKESIDGHVVVTMLDSGRQLIPVQTLKQLLK